VCGGISTIIDMPNQLPPTENAEQVDVKRKIGETKSMCDFAVLGVVHQTNADDILPMAKRGAIGYKIFFGETIGNLPFPDDGMCQIVFPNITESGVPLCIHAENRQIQHFWTNKLKAEGKNDPIYWESSRPWLCEAESIAHAMFLAENFGTKLHIVHASTKQAVQMLRAAKARGLRFTGETQPHYLLRVDTDLKGAPGRAVGGLARRLDRHDRHRPFAAHPRRKGLRHQWQDDKTRDLGLHLRLLRC
jgi:dihydroorotase-like cyclic amidohydrolase